MAFVSSHSAGQAPGFSRTIIAGLFVSSCLLSIVSWYTTEQGMALYLSTWFSLLASLGVQSALVLVAWLIGFTKSRRALLTAVYVVTALVSISFSYASLYTWFASRERPAMVERRLYDVLQESAGRAQQLLTSAGAEGQKHELALAEMTNAEKAHGQISRGQDADPYLAAVREAVAAEARTYSGAYPEGAGQGVRYTAFERYSQLARQSGQRLRDAAARLSAFAAQLKPLDASEKQLREFHQVYDGLPWSEVEQVLHAGRIERPTLPNYADFVDRTTTGQEDLLLAFRELFTTPTARHVFAFALAAFIDVIVFLLAFASGPYYFGSAEQRWLSAGAALEALDGQIFVRDFLRKWTPGARGVARVDAASLSPGEQQFCLILTAKGKAVAETEDGHVFYLLDPEVHEQLLDAISSQGFPLRASASSAAASS